MLKNRIITIILAMMLISPVFAENPESAVNEATPVQTEQAAPESFTYKQPISKRKIAKKFLLAMAGVGISSILLFVLLSLYNRIRTGIVPNKQESPTGETSLVTPDNLQDAVRTFLEKTKWD